MYCPLPRRDHRERSTTRARLWQAMRILRRFTVGELQVTSECHPPVARMYLCGLARCGYVKPLAGRGPAASYQLLKNTGPRYPRIGRDGTLYDPNRDAQVAPEVRS